MGIKIGIGISIGSSGSSWTAQDHKYYENIIHLFGSSIIQYIPLWETYGANKSVADISGNNYNGLTDPSYTDLLEYPGLGDKNVAGGNSTAAKFVDGNSWIDLINGNGLPTKFNRLEGGYLCWVKGLPEMWTGAGYENLINLNIDANNAIRIGRYGPTPYCLQAIIKGNGVTYATRQSYGGESGWFAVALSWSVTNGKFRAYINGTEYSPLTGSYPTVIGALSTAKIGSDYYSLPGSYTHSVLLDRAPTALEIDQFCNIGPLGIPPRITIIGDSISQGNSNLINWATSFYPKYKTGYFKVHNYAIGGAGVLVGSPNLAGQVTLADADDADIIIIALGTNDVDNDTIQSVATAQLAILKASNPRATIYWMGILPRNYLIDSGGVNNPRISAACTANGVTFWDTRTDPWIVTATDTDDGLHPNAIGVGKIVTKVISLLPA